MKIKKNSVTSLIKNAIDAESEITHESSMDDVPEWDSLGHLSILTSLDQATDGKASSISNLGDASSVSEIISILDSENLIDES